MDSSRQDIKISIILICHRKYQGCLKAIESINRQDNRQSVEVVLIVIENTEFKDQIHFPLLGIKIIYIEQLLSIGELRNIGIENSSGELIFFLEEHAEIVDPQTVDNIIQIYNKGYECIGGKIVIGNPGNSLSVPSALISFFPFINPVESGESDTLPGYNSIYSRKALNSLNKPLYELLGYEDFLIYELKKRNYRFYINTNIQIKHYFESSIIDSFKLHYYYNIGYGAYRKKIQNWSWFTLTIRVLMAFLIPIIRTAKTLENTIIYKPNYIKNIFLNFHILFIIQLATFIGSLAGYFFGQKYAVKKFAYLELNVKR